MAAQFSLHKCALAPGAEVVDRACDQLLAGSCLTVKQDRGIGGRDDRDLFQHFLEGWALADNVFEAVLGADLWFQIDLLVLRARSPWENLFLRAFPRSVNATVAQP